jgi:hypothetical protein
MGLKITVKTKIRFNGREYSRVEDMPPQIRESYEKALAKMQESKVKMNPRTATKLVFNGREYGSLDEMPADIRGLYEQVMTTVDSNQNGIPDMLEPGQPAATQPEWGGSQLIGAASPVAKDSRQHFPRGAVGRVVLMVLVIVLVALAAILLLSPSLFR